MDKLTESEAFTAKGNETRRRIFSAAVVEFSNFGFAGARIDRIADAAEVNKQRIYAYFGDKEGLFEEVWRRTADLIGEEDQHLCALSEADIPNLGPILLHRYSEFHEKHPEFWKIFVLENLMGEPHERASHEDVPYTHVGKLYERGQRNGFFDPEISFSSFLFVLIAVSFFYASNWKTMSETLAVDLADPSVKDRLFGEISRWLFGTNSSDDGRE